MRTTCMNLRSKLETSAAAGLAAVLAGLIVLAPFLTAAQQPQDPAQTRPAMALVYDSLKDILKGLATYDFADGVGALTRLRAYVIARKDDPQTRKETESALLEFVRSSPAPGGLMAACRALSLIGSDASVPVLGALLLKTETSDPARYALERIPGPGPDQALLAALDKAPGDVKRGIIFSLGRRASAAAVPALGRLASGKDLLLAADAVMALGKVGGPEAVQILTSALGKAGPRLKPELASALLVAAEGSLKTGEKAGASAVYDKLIAAKLPPVMRQAAFKGKIATAGDAAKGLILKALAGKDTVLYAPAISMVPANFGAGEVGQAADLFSRLPEDAQVQLAAVLGGYPADTARPYLLAAAESPSLAVRLAALRSIEKTGDSKSVVFLATKAARTAGAEQEAARESLARLRGSDVDAAVLAYLSKTSDDAVKAELVQAVSARRIAGAKPALIQLVKAAPPALQSRAAAALRNVAGTADIPDLVGLLLSLEDEMAREAMQDTVAAVARTNPREHARADAVEALLAAEKNPKNKADLLRVLGKIGDDTGLSLIRAALSDPDDAVVDAAVRALADWPTVTARDDLYEVARTSLVFNHRVLATRAYIRMIGLEPYRAPEGAAADLLRILALSPRPEEKKLVLGLLARFPCVTGLKTAESLLADPAVAAEAKLAADRIRQALGTK
jgi:HEAT repeat protein